MKREEKNIVSRQKILDSAMKEFSDKGYGLSSVNTICSEGGISKGILYHYFKDKDEIYLTCVKDCFDSLTGFMKKSMQEETGDVQKRLNRYFEERFRFFESYPVYQRIFCDAVIIPPAHLSETIREIKAEFDRLNIEILNEILSQVRLRRDVTRQEVIDTFCQYQDFINARYQMTGSEKIDAAQREETCRRALSVLMYGVVERSEE